MSAIGDAIQEKCLAFGDRVIKLNDFLLKEAANAKSSFKMVNGKRVYDKPVPVHLKSVANLSNQLLRAGTSIGANFASKREQRGLAHYAEPTNEARAEAKLALTMPCKEEEDEVNGSKVNEVKPETARRAIIPPSAHLYID